MNISTSQEISRIKDIDMDLILCEQSSENIHSFILPVKNVILVQTMQTQIRLLLVEQSDLGLHCLSTYPAPLGCITKMNLCSQLHDLNDAIEVTGRYFLPDFQNFQISFCQYIDGEGRCQV